MSPQPHVLRCALLLAFHPETTVLAGDSAAATVLWYRQPAQKWTEALPVGNGRLGAMVFGGVAQERLQLNENSVWSGAPQDADNPEALAALPEIRRLLWEGKHREADALGVQKLVGKNAGSGHGSGAQVPFGCYQTLGDLTWKDGQLATAVITAKTLRPCTVRSPVPLEVSGKRAVKTASPAPGVVVFTARPGERYMLRPASGR
jgi:hypothetical protein